MVRSTVIIDANLCILLVVGLTNPEEIAKHKRLSAFDKQDFFIIRDMLSKYSGLTCLPNVFTETSNLLRPTNESFSLRASETLARIVRSSQEVFIESRKAVEQREYTRLGITDAALMILAESGGTLLTVDLELYIAASKARMSSINYNHIRAQRADF